jgi:hypothetical protein
MIGDDQAVKVYEGKPADVMFLKSLLESAGIEIVTAGSFFGPGHEIYVRGRDVADARAIIADVQSQPTQQSGDVLPGPWPKEPKE